MGPRVDPTRPRRRDTGSRLSTTVDAVSRATTLQDRRSKLHDADPVAATQRTLLRIQALFLAVIFPRQPSCAIDPSSLRQAGLSWRRIGTLRDLAERLSDRGGVE